MEKHSEVKVIVLPSLGSSGGIKALKHRKIDLALTSRPLKNKERTDGLTVVHYATTPLVFAVSNISPQRALSREQVNEIYMGKVNQWPDGSPLRPILRPFKDSDTIVIKDTLIECKKCLFDAYQRRGIPIAMTDQESADMIARIPGAIGTSSLSLMLSEKKPIKAVKLNGVMPSVENLRNETYPIYKKLFFVYKKDHEIKYLDAFIEFIFSKKAQDILLQTGHLVTR